MLIGTSNCISANHGKKVMLSSVLVNGLNNTSGVTAVTPTDRPKSVRNRCVIKVLVAFIYVVALRF